MTAQNHRTRIVVLAAFMVPVAAAVPAASGFGGVAGDGAHPPEVAAIVDGYIQATGGLAAYTKLYNRVSKERVIHVGMGFEDKVVIYAAMPAKRSTTIESDAFGLTRSGTNGELAWYVSDRTGPLVFEGETLASELHAAVFDRWSKWRTLYASSRASGTADVDGKRCHKVVMTPTVGPEETYYFDEQSKLLVKVEKQRLFSGMPPLPVTAVLSDYRKVDGILVPHQVTQVMNQCGSKREMTFVTDHIRFNVDIPQNQFDPPSEVLSVATKNSIVNAVKAIFTAGDGEKTPDAPCAKKQEQKRSSPCGGK